ncbi:hypothetical protein HELRODRAFT_177518 [Helobdella robusta]|uniref:Uncharacterized protein n=1 Tax=Helobdella robusta TaxID=6412 RepID=T1FBU2_HELRO|nr:hypothetical protein HELRODRAFT_177518 [Helobdella robusta]ESN97876.1 hypothetical protein HELRODRAFT_177518 [Helobdella robusta]
MAKKIFHYLPTYAAVQFNFPSSGYFFNKLVSPNQATPLQETPHARTVDLINKPKNEPKLDIKPNTLFANVDLIKNCLEGGGGSLIDYALAKENLYLEIEMSRINMIVMGFPVEIQNQLDREEITTIEKLFKELTKIDECVSNIKPKYDNKFLSNEISYNTDVKTKQLYQHKQRYENVDKEISVPKYKVEVEYT